MTHFRSIHSKRTKLKGALSISLLAGTLAVGFPANTALFAQEAALPVAAASTTVADFDDSFAKFDAVPPAAEPAPHAVDITEIEPPIEVAPEPEPEPEAGVRKDLGTGVASYYGKRFAGRKTANGERFNPGELTAAHKTLPFGSKVRVTNPRNGKSVTVRINDRGPYAHGRSIDLSRAAAEEIGIVQRGHGNVQMALLDS